MMEKVKRLNSYLQDKRIFLLLTLNLALVLFIILEIALLFSISPPREHVLRDCALSNVGTCH